MKEMNLSIYLPAISLLTGKLFRVFEVNDPMNEFASETSPGLSGDYTAGESSAFGPITVFYSRKSGNWDDPLQRGQPTRC
jgi:hypothetical protein